MITFPGTVQEAGTKKTTSILKFNVNLDHYHLFSNLFIKTVTPQDYSVRVKATFCENAFLGPKNGHLDVLTEKLTPDEIFLTVNADRRP